MEMAYRARWKAEISPMRRVLAGLAMKEECRSYLYHFGTAKQRATRTARIEKAMPAIFEGRGFLERHR